MDKVYIYVVDRDFGFAPNPFHGSCTLATCKSKIRSTAAPNDWVIGMGGSRLKATSRCIFAMRVTDKITFHEYWANPLYLDKKPIRNGSRKMMVGDNIYHFDVACKIWAQADSHHSNSDGTTNLHNRSKDLASLNVLISRHFYYFGREAPEVSSSLLSTIGYQNGIGHRVYQAGMPGISDLIQWLHDQGPINQLSGDPFDFDQSDMRYSGDTNTIS